MFIERQGSGNIVRFEYEVRSQLNRAIEAKRGAWINLKPSYQLVISALAWSLGEGRKDSFGPGPGRARGEYEIRSRVRRCIERKDKARIDIISKNWQIIISCLEWVLGDSDIMPLEARENIYHGGLVG